MEPSTVLEHRQLYPVCPYDPDAWERLLQEHGLLEQYRKIPDGFHNGLTCIYLVFQPHKSLQITPHLCNIVMPLIPSLKKNWIPVVTLVLFLALNYMPFWETFKLLPSQLSLSPENQGGFEPYTTFPSHSQFLFNTLILPLIQQ
jgi:hypothetical protein